MAQANGASVQAVYDTLNDLANKDQQGFITDVEFNRFAQIAQLNIYNSLFDELKDAKRLSRAGFNPVRDKSRIKRIQEDLSYFSKKATVTKEGDIFNKPTDLSRIISISTAGSILLDQSTKKPVEVCYDEEKIERILLNNLSAPTEDFPVALVSDDIHVFPTSIKKLEVRYYKIPEGRVSGERTSIPQQPTYDADSQNVDFELPEHYTSDLVYEIAKMIGLNLRDQQITNYTNQEMQVRKQAETF
tara:strand:- start:1813 stop:2547 length:735 start_codon:yes stop_codon:yes gene_type:complete